MLTQNIVKIICSPGSPTGHVSIHDICVSDSKIQDLDFSVRFKHHIKSGNVMDALTLCVDVSLDICVNCPRLLRLKNCTKDLLSKLWTAANSCLTASSSISVVRILIICFLLVLINSLYWAPPNAIRPDARSNRPYSPPRCLTVSGQTATPFIYVPVAVQSIYIIYMP